MFQRFINTEIKKSQNQDGSNFKMSFVASTDSPDRYGDIVAVDGWELDAYRSNPIVLLNHDHNSALPIGKGNVRIAPEGLLIDVEFDMSDPKAAEVAGKVERGFMNAVSVGFAPIESTPRADLPEEHFAFTRSGGNFFSKAELLEVSIVTIPANPEAVAIAAKDYRYEMRSFITQQIEAMIGAMPKAEIIKELNDEGDFEIMAPDGYHWMNNEGGPVLMEGEYEEHEGASPSFAFEVISEHDPERLGYGDSGMSDEDSEDEDKEFLKALLTIEQEAAQCLQK